MSLYTLTLRWGARRFPENVCPGGRLKGRAWVLFVPRVCEWAWRCTPQGACCGLTTGRRPLLVPCPRRARLALTLGPLPRAVFCGCFLWPSRSGCGPVGRRPEPGGPSTVFSVSSHHCSAPERRLQGTFARQAPIEMPGRGKRDSEIPFRVSPAWPLSTSSSLGYCCPLHWDQPPSGLPGGSLTVWA